LVLNLFLPWGHLAGPSAIPSGLRLGVFFFILRLGGFYGARGVVGAVSRVVGSGLALSGLSAVVTRAGGGGPLPAWEPFSPQDFTRLGRFTHFTPQRRVVGGWFPFGGGSPKGPGQFSWASVSAFRRGDLDQAKIARGVELYTSCLGEKAGSSAVLAGAWLGIFGITFLAFLGRRGGIPWGGRGKRGGGGKAEGGGPFLGPRDSSELKGLWKRNPGVNTRHVHFFQLFDSI